MVGFCKHGDKHLNSNTAGDPLSNYQTHKENKLYYWISYINCDSYAVTVKATGDGGHRRLLFHTNSQCTEFSFIVYKSMQ